MNDFFLASNGSLFKGDIEIKQVLVKDLDQWSKFAEPIRITLKNIFDDESLGRVIDEFHFQAIMIMPLVTNVAEIDPELLENKGELLELLKVVIQVNSAYFNQEISNKDGSNDDYTWFDSFQFLISKGHKHSDILNYSYGTFREYIKAAQRNERNTLLSISGNIRVAYHADKKGYEKYIKDMKN